MTDKQRKEAMEWVEKEIEDREACVKSLVGEFDYYPTKDEEEQCAFLEESLGYLKTILSALEPKVMNMAWVKKWDSEFLYDLVHRNGMTMHTWKAMLNELGIAVKGE
uniref:Uncharacterized protein n=2 Tax=viral metagenome TaxID=1070528 RepID=A0A6M3Y1Y2_9ZZZZ